MNRSAPVWHSRRMASAWLQHLSQNSPRPLLYSGVSAVGLGVVGGVVGLILGLEAYPPTAWAAVFEVGAPAAFLGATIGLLVGSIVSLVRARRG
jgi:hypothetical protein